MKNPAGRAIKKPAPPLPGCCPGDEVFFKGGGQAMSGRVVCHGKHGATVECGGKHHKVRWEDVHGHKSRASSTFTVVERGESGAIVADGTGRRVFVAGYQDPIEMGEVERDTAGPAGGEMAKSLTPRVLLFAENVDLLKALANRPGLTLQQVTDKRGRQTKRWKRTGQEMPGERRHAVGKPGTKGGPAGGRRKEDPEEKRGAAAGYGMHNIEAGDRISYRADDGVDHVGEITGTAGEDGVHVKDRQGNIHKVLFETITGMAPKAGTKKPDVGSTVLGYQEPIPADRFGAAAYAHSHDATDVTPEEILKSFPTDTLAKIHETQQRLKGLEDTQSKFKTGPAGADGKPTYTPERLAFHNKLLYEGITKSVIDEKTGDLVEKFFPPLFGAKQRAGAMPKDGAAPTFYILGGRGGSGKSWFKKNLIDPESVIYLDADAIKERLPEYEGWNAAEVHEESSDIFDDITKRAQELGLNIVHDATMKTPDKAVKLVKRFKDAGYRTEAHYMHLPRQEAAKRAVSRFLGKTQRYVPIDVILENVKNEHAFDQVKGLVDQWSFRDNNVPHGSDPILISESGEGSPKNHKKGEEKPLHKSLTGPMIAVWRIS